MLGLLRSTRPVLLRDTVSLPEHVTVDGRLLAVTVSRNPRARRLTLRIERDGSGIRVTVPPHVPAREIATFIERHHDWLTLKLSQYPDRPQLKPGLKVPYLGRAHVIIVHDGTRGTTRITEGADGPELHVHGGAAQTGKRVADFLKRDAKRMIEPMALDLARKTGKRVRRITFRDTSSRWGSCTSDGALSFSWRIMMAPRKIVHYLVAHEVAHLTHLDHSAAFWALTKDLCPDTDECRAWLKRNGAKLQAIGF